jgi:photosystem II stability/assembly factor-like uncharacterized protein
MTRPTRLSAPAAASIAFALLALLTGCSKGPTAPRIIPPLSSIVLTPASDTMQVGQSRTFTAVARDTNGAVIATYLNWASTNAAVFSVAGQGNVTANGEGVALLIASGGGAADTSVVFVYPDTGWIAQTSNATEDLHGVHFRPDGRHGWAVGAGGVILRTTDAGVTWTRSLPTTFSLNGVCFVDDTTGFAVGNSGTVMKTTDSGGSWTRLTNTNTSMNLMDVTFALSDSLIGWAVGQNGVVLRTIDLGATWQMSFVNSQTLHGVSFAGARDGWAVGDNGMIAGTHDRGLTWFVVQPSVTTLALQSVWRADSTTALAVGVQGAAPRTLVSADSTTWILQNAGATYTLQGLSLVDGVGFAVGTNGLAAVVLRTDDVGATWQLQSPRSQFKLNHVFFVDRLRGWAVGDNGTIRHTARGGGS